MRYAGTRGSEHNPLRSMPLVRSAALFSGPTEVDRPVGDLRNALWSVAGFVRAYDAARAGLGRANGHNKAWRKSSQRDAMGALNRARGAMKSNARQIAVLQARLLALAVPADLWADAAAAAQAARQMVFVKTPDAALLVLCGELQILQGEWQALWNATSDKGNVGSAADKALDDFEDHVWPGYLADPEGDVVVGLATLPATTAAGFGLRRQRSERSRMLAATAAPVATTSAG